jgi:hypothetical protein
MNNNGRIDIITPNIDNLFKLKDNIPVSSFDYRGAVDGNWYTTQLSNLYFSKDNIDIIQNGLRVGVYNMSNTKYIISRQDNDELQTIMRSIFLQHSKNLPNNITNQIDTLNKKVLDYSIKQIYGEAQGYIKYKRDVSTLSEPLSPPIMSRPSDKQLEFKKWF